MENAPIPENDEARLDALHDYELLAGSPESWFDHVASVASSLCQTPSALVSLVDRDEVLLKAASGMPPGVGRLSREESLCGHAILEEGIFEVSDATGDERFHDNPLVTTDPGVRFYAGAPLINEAGYALGTVCVIDHEPRCLTDDQRAGLISLAEVVMQHMETRRNETFGRPLERLEARNLALVARLTDNPVIITDSQGRIEWANPSFEQMTGYPLDDVTGKRPGAFLQGPETDTETRRRISTGLDRGEPVREVILNYGADGRRYWLDLDIQPVRDEQDELTHFVAVQTDITRLKEMEEHQRRARQAAEAANDSKTAFLANVSHELRTPLNGIIGIAEILERNPDRRDRRDQLAALQESASGLLGLINDLLDLSQIEAGSMRINPHSFRLSRHLRKLDHLLRPEAERKGIGLILEMDPGMPDDLHGDGERLCQILINLLSNAIKFTKTGTVRLSIDAPSTSGETARVVFTVSDTGPGMPESVQDHIFEPFSQADSTVARQYRGAGLGLAICRRLVRLMEGSIRLDSEVGKGTTFTVTLPFATASQADMPSLEADAECSTAPSLAVHDYRVLLVEDSEINRHVATAMLDDLGLHAVGCESGREALEVFRSEAFDLVLLDIQMPDMTGYEVVEAMRAIEAERGDRTPILAVTAHSESVASLDARSEAFDALVSKPVTFQGLQDAVRRWLAVSEESASDGSSRSSRHNPGTLIDEALVRSNLSGDDWLFHTLMDLFERQHGHYLELIDRAAGSGDATLLADAAHKLKGAVGYFNQSGLWQDVAELEKVAGEEEAEKTTARVEQIRVQVLALAEEVRYFNSPQATASR